MELDRSPYFLRIFYAGEEETPERRWCVVTSGPASTEGEAEGFIYELEELPGEYRITRGPHRTMKVARYRLYEQQPAPDILRDETKWREWVEAQAMARERCRMMNLAGRK